MISFFLMVYNWFNRIVKRIFMKLNRKKEIIIGISLAIIAVIIVFVTEQFFKPVYLIKSIVKVLSFVSAMVIYSISTHKKLFEVIHLRKIRRIRPLVICMLLFLVGMLVVFLIFKRFIDLNNIKQNLLQKENLTKDNCLYVFSYIVLCNSLLEESFFRGFVTGVFDNRLLGAIISSILFSLYHIGIFISWFNPIIFVLCVIGLSIVGLFLQWISEKYDSILASYMTHGCANVSINIIGFLLIMGII